MAFAVFDDAGVSPLNKDFLKIILFINKRPCSPNREVLAFVPPSQAIGMFHLRNFGLRPDCTLLSPLQSIELDYFRPVSDAFRPVARRHKDRRHGSSEFASCCCCCLVSNWASGLRILESSPNSTSSFNMFQLFV